MNFIIIINSRFHSSASTSSQPSAKPAYRTSPLKSSLGWATQTQPSTRSSIRFSTRSFAKRSNAYWLLVTRIGASAATNRCRWITKNTSRTTVRKLWWWTREETDRSVNFPVNIWAVIQWGKRGLIRRLTCSATRSMTFDRTMIIFRTLWCREMTYIFMTDFCTWIILVCGNIFLK